MSATRTGPLSDCWCHVNRSNDLLLNIYLRVSRRDVKWSASVVQCSVCKWRAAAGRPGPMVAPWPSWPRRSGTSSRSRPVWRNSRRCPSCRPCSSPRSGCWTAATLLNILPGMTLWIMLFARLPIYLLFFILMSVEIGLALVLQLNVIFRYYIHLENTGLQCLNRDSICHVFTKCM